MLLPNILDYPHFSLLLRLFHYTQMNDGKCQRNTSTCQYLFIKEPWNILWKESPFSVSIFVTTFWLIRASEETHNFMKTLNKLFGYLFIFKPEALSKVSFVRVLSSTPGPCQYWQIYQCQYKEKYTNNTATRLGNLDPFCPTGGSIRTVILPHDWTIRVNEVFKLNCWLCFV